MKKYISLILILQVVIFTSCKDDFLETGPSKSVGEKFAENTEQGLTGILEGIHYMMYSYYFGQGFGAGQESVAAQLDLLGDYFICMFPNGIYVGVYNWESHTNPNSSTSYKMWDFYYTIILHSNKLIRGVNNTEGLSEKVKNTLLGEAYAFRAWAYHNLVQLYGKRYVKGEANSQLGVIIRTEEHFMEPLPRSSVAEVYEYIDTNISQALDLLQKVPDKKIKNAIRYSTACGIAARIALTKGEWAEAEKYAEEAIAKSGAQLQGESLLDGFNNWNSSEWMWAYKQNETQDVSYGGFFAHYSYNFKARRIGKFRFAVNRTIYDKMGEKDVRRGWWVCYDRKDEIPADANKTYFKGGNKKPKWAITGQSIKYKAESYTSSFGDILIMRLAEMYYIAAEAEARQGKDGEAQSTLNKIMKTRDVEYKTDATGEALIDEVMRNKRIDLWMEGRRFFDLKRLSIVFNRMEAGNFKYLKGQRLLDGEEINTGLNVEKIATSPDSKYWEFAIPYDELEGNKLCEQNPL